MTVWMRSGFAGRRVVRGAVSRAEERELGARRQRCGQTKLIALRQKMPQPARRIGKPGVGDSDPEAAMTQTPTSRTTNPVAAPITVTSPWASHHRRATGMSRTGRPTTRATSADGTATRSGTTMMAMIDTIPSYSVDMATRHAAAVAQSAAPPAKKFTRVRTPH